MLLRVATAIISAQRLRAEMTRMPTTYNGPLHAETLEIKIAGPVACFSFFSRFFLVSALSVGLLIIHGLKVLSLSVVERGKNRAGESYLSQQSFLPIRILYK